MSRYFFVSPAIVLDFQGKYIFRETPFKNISSYETELEPISGALVCIPCFQHWGQRTGKEVVVVY